MKTFLLFLATHLCASYCDAELEQLWSSIQDINHPTLEEYQRIDRYLAAGARPYLDRLRTADPFCPSRMQSILNFRLVSHQMPIFEQSDFNLTDSTSGRCILLYSSSNGIYPEKARKLLWEIGQSGYSGHVLLRIGGFPNTQFGGLNICHVPYAFKVAFLQEAKHLGFTEVLWLDLAIHPLADFETIFWAIEQQGFFFTEVGTLQGNRPTHLLQAAEELHITLDLYSEISHISSSMIGLNMENSKALQLLDRWYSAAEQAYPFMTWWPEELSLSVIAWRIGCPPFGWLGSLVCTENELSQLQHRPTVQFYLDAFR